MPLNGSGGFTRVHDWSSDAAGGIAILASRFDAENDDFAAVFNLGIYRDGQAPYTGNQPMGANRFLNAGDAQALQEYATAKQSQNNAFGIGPESGLADAYIVTVSPAPSAYVDGQQFSFISTNTNTGPSTINVNALGVIPLVAPGNRALTAGELASGELQTVQIQGGGTRAETHGRLTKGDTFQTGTRMVFHQASAPTGWLIDTDASLDNAALRFSNSTGGSSGGTNTFDSVFGATPTAGNHVLIEAELPTVTPTIDDPGHVHNVIGKIGTAGGANTLVQIVENVGTADGVALSGAAQNVTGITVNSFGSDQGHNHTMDIKFAECIIAIKQ